MYEIILKKVKSQIPNPKYQTNSNDQNSKFQTYLSMILKKEQPNGLVIGYWNLVFFVF
jgi:hypothetical protein